MIVTTRYIQDDITDSSKLGILHERNPKVFSLQTLWNGRSVWFTPIWDIDHTYRWLVDQGYSTFDAYEMVMADAKADFERILDYFAGKWTYVGIEAVVEAEGVILSRRTLWGLESDSPDLEEKELWVADQAIADAEDVLERLKTPTVLSVNMVREY